MKKLEDLTQAVRNIEADFVKFDQKGVKASGGRLRKVAQTSKKLWQDLRIEIMSKLKAK